jgi:hypothetical protein
MKLAAPEQPQAPQLEMPDRFRMEIVYFMTPPGERGAPAKLGENEYWIDTDEARQWLDEGRLCRLATRRGEPGGDRG